MGSNWNGWMEAVCAADLTVAEHRLAAALGREILGWRKTSDRIGARRLRELARLDGRTFERARQGLVEKGLLRYIPGKVGRGGRGYYELLETADPERPIEGPEKTAVERAIRTEEKTAPERAIARSVKDRSQSTKKTALQRSRSGSKGKNSAQSADTDFRRAAFDAYLSTGGSLLLERERGALARSVTALLKAGVDETTILAACRDLGRERAFPGLLKQRVQEINDRGGPCDNEGLDRSRMTAAQLNACGCTRCEEWITALGVV